MRSWLKHWINIWISWHLDMFFVLCNVPIEDWSLVTLPPSFEMICPLQLHFNHSCPAVMCNVLIFFGWDFLQVCSGIQMLLLPLKKRREKAIEVNVCIGWPSVVCWMWAMGWNICNIWHECDDSLLTLTWCKRRDLFGKENCSFNWSCGSFVGFSVMWHTQLSLMCTMHHACPTLITTFDHPPLYVLNLSSLPLCPGINRQVIIELMVLSCTVLGHQLRVFCEAVKNGSWSSLLNAQIQRHHQASQVWDKELFVDIVTAEQSLTPRCCLFLHLFSTLSLRVSNSRN